MTSRALKTMTISFCSKQVNNMALKDITRGKKRGRVVLVKGPFHINQIYLKLPFWFSRRLDLIDLWLTIAPPPPSPRARLPLRGNFASYDFLKPQCIRYKMTHVSRLAAEAFASNSRVTNVTLRIIIIKKKTGANTKVSIFTLTNVLFAVKACTFADNFRKTLHRLWLVVLVLHTLLITTCLITEFNNITVCRIIACKWLKMYFNMVLQKKYSVCPPQIFVHQSLSRNKN